MAGSRRSPTSGLCQNRGRRSRACGELRLARRPESGPEGVEPINEPAGSPPVLRSSRRGVRVEAGPRPGTAAPVPGVHVTRVQSSAHNARRARHIKRHQPALDPALSSGLTRSICADMCGWLRPLSGRGHHRVLGICIVRGCTPLAPGDSSSHQG